MYNTLVCNFLGGPGTGKSTMAGSVYSELKWRGIETEIVFEFAKELVWEKRTETFKDQIYIFGEQYHRIFRLLNQVEVIVVDSPLLLTPIYDQEHRSNLESLSVNEFNRFNNYNIFISREKPYNPNGRNQDENGAIEKDCEILRLLNRYNVQFDVLPGRRDSIIPICDRITTQLLPTLSRIHHE